MFCRVCHAMCSTSRALIYLAFYETICSSYRKTAKKQARWHLQECTFCISKFTEWIQPWMQCVTFYYSSPHLLFSPWVPFLIVSGGQLAMAKDPEAAFFKRLEGLQPCEVSELKAGTHIFAVYGTVTLFCSGNRSRISLSYLGGLILSNWFRR